jgi:hypothetical protein
MDEANAGIVDERMPIKVCYQGVQERKMAAAVLIATLWIAHRHAPKERRDE